MPARWTRSRGQITEAVSRFFMGSATEWASKSTAAVLRPTGEGPFAGRNVVTVEPGVYLEGAACGSRTLRCVTPGEVVKSLRRSLESF